MDTLEMNALSALVKKGIGVLICCSLGTTSGFAATISWTDWTARTVGKPGSATGTITLPTSSTIGVSYAGEVFGNTNIANTGNPSWGPAATFADGVVVANAPPTGNMIALTGGSGTGVDTITFSSPVLNPVMAIWSLGQGGNNTSFVFSNATPSFVSGGKSNEFQGSPITVSGNTVSGIEGNGTIQFLGTFSSLSWTNPKFENYYGFTVGIAGPGVVPEPRTYLMLIAGLGLVLTLIGRRRSIPDASPLPS